MKYRIRKLNQLKTLESFIQVNFYKGYKYIGKAGELVNSFYKGHTPPQFTMSLDGLIIPKPDEYAEEMKISSTGYWAHYLNPASLDQVATFFLKPYERITQILEVEKITRVGWRNYFVYEYQNLDEREKVLSKFNLKGKLKIQGLGYALEIRGVSSAITIRKVEKNDKTKIPALLLDIDSFKNFKEPQIVKQSSKELLGIREMLQSDEFLEEINQIIE